MNIEKLKHYIEYYDLILNKSFDHENRFYINKVIETFKPKKISLWKKILFPFYYRLSYCHNKSQLICSNIVCVNKIVIQLQPRILRVAYWLSTNVVGFSHTTSEMPTEGIKINYDDLNSIGFLLKDYGNFELISCSETHEDYDLNNYIEVNKYEKTHYLDIDKVYVGVNEKLGEIGFNLKKEDFMELHSGRKIEGNRLSII